MDLPRTVDRSGATFEASGVPDRVTTVGQSFFDPLRAGADLKLLKGIINDWPDWLSSSHDSRALYARGARQARGQ